jgi:hypothetical protein
MTIARACVLVLTVFPSASAGQTLARTFADLLTMLAPKELIVVTDATGRQTMGPIESVSADAFTVAVTEKTPTGSRTGAERRTFREADVKSVRRVTGEGVPGPVIYPVSWERVHALPAGSLVRVSFTDGKTDAFRFAFATTDSLAVTGASGQAQTISKREITRVMREQYRDGVGNGIAIGALVGAGTMAALTTFAYVTCDEGCEAPAPVPFYIASMAFGAGIGAAAGWLIDYFHKGSDVVFPVVAVIAPGVKALFFARRF